MDYAVSKRLGGELLDVREFVRPDTYMISELLRRENFLTPEQAWAWVLANIRYPWGPEETQDYHILYGYWRPDRPAPRLAYRTDDYWNFPSETLRDGVGDCEDTAILLVSILRRRFPGLPAYVTVGYYQGYGHVWVGLFRDGQWRVLDTTLRRPVPPPVEGPPYRALFRFHEREVLVRRWQVPARIREEEKARCINANYNRG